MIDNQNDYNWIQKNTGRPLAIGGAVNDDCYGSFNGAMDEVRVAMKVLSADWETADYSQQTDAAFLALGSPVDVDTSSPSVGS